MNTTRSRKQRRRGPGANSRRRRLWPTVMALEGRTLLSTFMVTSTADDGSGRHAAAGRSVRRTPNNKPNTIDLLEPVQYAADDQPDRRSARALQPRDHHDHRYQARTW